MKILAAVLLFFLVIPNGSAIAREEAYEPVNETAPFTEDESSYYIRPHASGTGYVVMLPLSSVLYEYADISRDEERGIVDITCGTLDVKMEIGSTAYIINGEKAELDAAPEIIGGAVYVPSGFFERTFGFWTTDSGEGIIDLFMPSSIIDSI